MSNIEKIKFGEQTFDLVAAGVNLEADGGTIKFQMGDKTFEEIEDILQANGTIKQIAISGDTDWSRADLVYGDFMSRDANYVIGKADDGVTDITAAVMIAIFKTPDLTERIAALEAENAEIKKDNESLKATVGTLLLSSLEV
jgi:hypothetical protein